MPSTVFNIAINEAHRSLQRSSLAIAPLDGATHALDGAVRCLMTAVRELANDFDSVRPAASAPASGDAAKAEAFDRIAAFIGAAGRVAGSASPSDLLHEIGNIVGTVRGVPSPNADDTEAHYRDVAATRLTAKQRKLVGLWEERR